MKKNYSRQRDRRRAKIRARVKGTTQKPRLVVFRSHQHLYGQVIDDQKRITLAAFSDQQLEKGGQGLSKTDQAKLVGQELAKRAREKGVKEIVFDRAGYQYHGRVKALAEAARKGGLKF